VPGRHRETLERARHRQHRRLQDIELVNLGLAALGDRKMRTGNDLQFKLRARLGGQFLAVIQSPDRVIIGKDDHRRHHRTREWPPARFIDPRNHRSSSGKSVTN